MTRGSQSRHECYESNRKKCSIGYIKYDGRYLTMKMQNNKHITAVRSEHLVFYHVLSSVCFLSAQSVHFYFPVCLIYLGPESPVLLTHLIHITGPLHDVLERSLTRDVIHQEDSLMVRNIRAFKTNWIPVNKPDYHTENWQPCKPEAAQEVH